MSQSCSVCYQQTNIIGLMPCNHKYLCQMCSMKLKKDDINYICPFCKTPSETILFSNILEEDYDVLIKSQTIQRCRVKDKQGFLYLNRTVKNLVDIENYIVCCFNNCLHKFNSLNQLKKHLDQSHEKQFCDLCLMNRKCLLSQQIIYSEDQLYSHLNKGQYQQTGIYHPYCKFCKIRCYDQQSFLKHMQYHWQCSICKQNSIYFMYYKDYTALKKHFEKSHFICKVGGCSEKQLENVYATEYLRDFHHAEVHLRQEFSNKQKKQRQSETIIIKDDYGINIQKQLISISRSYELNRQVHTDTIIDIRQFYNDRCNSTKNMGIAEVINKIYKAIECLVQEFGSHKQIDEIPLEFIDIFKPLMMKNLNKQEISDLINELYLPKQAQKIKCLFFKEINNFIKFQEFCSRLKKVLIQNNRLVYFFYIFPQFIRYFQKENDDKKKKMDYFYMKQLLDLRPKNSLLLHEFRNYGKFVQFLKESIEQVINKRIKEKNIDLNLYVKRLKNQKFKQNDKKQVEFFVNKEKIILLYRMIQNVKTHQLLKLNWLLKLGFSDLEPITKNLYLGRVEDAIIQLDKLKNEQLALLYYYYKIVLQTLQSKRKFNKQKENADVHLLKQFFDKYQYAAKQYQYLWKNYKVNGKSQIKNQEEVQLFTLSTYPNNIHKIEQNKIYGLGNNNNTKNLDKNEKVDQRRQKSGSEQLQKKKLQDKKINKQIKKKDTKEDISKIIILQKRKIQPDQLKDQQLKSMKLAQQKQIIFQQQQRKLKKEIKQEIKKQNKIYFQQPKKIKQQYKKEIKQQIIQNQKEQQINQSQKQLQQQKKLSLKIYQINQKKNQNQNIIPVKKEEINIKKQNKSYFESFEEKKIQPKVVIHNIQKQINNNSIVNTQQKNTSLVNDKYYESNKNNKSFNLQQHKKKNLSHKIIEQEQCPQLDKTLIQNSLIKQAILPNNPIKTQRRIRKKNGKLKIQETVNINFRR